MKYHFLTILLLVFSLIACQNNNQVNTSKTTEVKKQKKTVKQFQNKGHELIYKMVQKVGTYQDFLDKKDVVYTYTYQTPDGKKDVSTEKYIFDGELSLAVFEQHDRTFPQLEGSFTQGYNGQDFWLKHNNNYLTDETMIKRVQFSRKTNFYWFAMFQKLLDPGLVYEYIKEASIDGKVYDVVNVSFTSKDNKPTDIYQLFINRKTDLVDQFLFTIADFNVMDEPRLMKMEYEKIDGMLIPTKRRYKKSNWDAEINNEPWIDVTWSDVKFDNNLSKREFNKN